MDYKEKVIALLNSQELSKEQKEMLETIFPELRESEDERIRKLLVEAVTQVLQDRYCSNRGVSKEKVIAWLEKQGEQNKQEKDIILCHLWHNESEKCLDKKAYILFHSTYDNTWNVFTACRINWNVVDKWAYLSDIINIVNKDSKQSEQKPANWLQELEDKLANATPQQLAEWKEKYFKEESVEWSEEDEIRLKHILRLLDVKDDKKYLLMFGLNSLQDLKKDIAWLKSLRPQNSWKPSDEQIKALNYVVNIMASSERPTENDLYYNILKSLREQLRKLKG